MRAVPERERGAALLTVLLLVAVMGALAAAAFDRLSFSTALATSSAGLDQARGYAIGIEKLATLTIDDIVAASPERTTLAGGWNGAGRTVPLPGGGVAQAVVRDGGNCFNLNSVASGNQPTQLTPRGAGIDQFEALMVLVGVPPAEARPIAEAAGDWVDGDMNRNRQGAEDDHYRALETPYRAANTLFADPSELRAVAGMTPEAYERLRPWLCALPTTDLSPINVNTLAPEQAPLLAMLAPVQIPLRTAEQLLARRPAAGWASTGAFYEELGNPNLPNDVLMQPQLRTRWFTADIGVALAGAELEQRTLIDARYAPARVVARTWGEVD